MSGLAGYNLGLNNKPRSSTMEIFDKIRGAVNVRGYFEQYLVKQYKGEVSIEKFKAMSEVIQIGIIYHFITKQKICPVIMPNNYYCIIEDNEKTRKDLISMEKMGIVRYAPTLIYILEPQDYQGSIFVGLKLAVIDIISFLDTTQWLKHLTEQRT